MEDEFLITCPYCGETLTIYLEPDITGTLIQDCEVCCNPWRLQVVNDRERRHVYAGRADGSE